jgi:hypothetical protein
LGEADDLVTPAVSGITAVIVTAAAATALIATVEATFCGQSTEASRSSLWA